MRTQTPAAAPAAPGVATISTTVVLTDDPHALRRLLEVFAPTSTTPTPTRPTRARRLATSDRS